MKLKFTILGCGSSGGVPRLDSEWGKCDPANPRNRRRRCSLLAERGEGAKRTRVLIDTSPDLREQLLGTGSGHVDAVLYTHDHADHTHGIDELRVVALNTHRRVPVYADSVTGESLRNRFVYCFRDAPGYGATLEYRQLEAGRPVRIDGGGGQITALPFLQQHSAAYTSMGFRIGGLAYSPDVSDLPEESWPALEGLDCWIVDALRMTPHPGHFSVDQALGWIERFKPKRAILTHMHVDLDYETLRKLLPAHVEPAYDGMELEWEGPNAGG
jgi:phosphoribosyl 1,2-cyclic phosphate phosphodiesterase